MRTTKIGLTVYLLITLMVTTSAQANILSQVLDLNRISQFSYFGQDDLRRRASCHLEVDPPQRDFAGRVFQNFRVWVDPNQYAVTLKYKGAARQLSPDSQTGANQLRFSIKTDGFELEMLTTVNDTNNIVEYRLSDVGGVTGHPGVIVNCKGVRNIIR